MYLYLYASEICLYFGSRNYVRLEQRFGQIKLSLVYYSRKFPTGTNFSCNKFSGTNSRWNRPPFWTILSSWGQLVQCEEWLDCVSFRWLTARPGTWRSTAHHTSPNTTGSWRRSSWSITRTGSLRESWSVWIVINLHLTQCLGWSRPNIWQYRVPRLPISEGNNGANQRTEFWNCDGI